MNRIGGILALIGVASIVFHFLDRELTILTWIDNWGEGPAWGIRVGLVVVGLVMFVSGNKKKRKA